MLRALVIVPGLSLGLLGLGLWSAPAAASVEVRSGEEGRVLVTNDGPIPTGTRSSAARGARLRERPAGPSMEMLDALRTAAVRNDLDPELVRAVIRAESGWNVRALSRKGAMGLMQIMPATARELSLEEPFEPRANIRAGSRYLRKMLDRFDGDVVLALAAYNAGPTAVVRFGGVPPYGETVRYVRRVLRLWRGEAAPEVESAVGRGSRGGGADLAPARPVRWHEAGARPHLSNVQ